LEEGNVGLRKHYEFHQCLFEASATCSVGSAHAGASASGEFNTTMDFGVSLIGTLLDFKFTEAFSYFRQEAFEARVQVAIEAKAKPRCDSGFQPVGTFDAFGSNYNIKGILQINPYFSAAARVQAEATISAQATVELTLQHDRFQYYQPTTLAPMPTEPGGNFKVTSRSGPISTLGDVSASVGGDIIVSVAPTIGFDIKLAFVGKQLVDTSLKLTSQADVSFGIAATAGTSCNGLQLDIKGQFQTELIVENALPGWKSGTFQIEQASPTDIYSDCIPWTPTKRGLFNGSMMEDQSLVTRQTSGENLGSLTKGGFCAFSVKGIFEILFLAEALGMNRTDVITGVYCAEDKQDDPSPDCNIYDLEEPDDDSISNDEADLIERDDDETVVISTLLDGFLDHTSSSVSRHHRHAHKARDGIAHKLEKRGSFKLREFCSTRASKGSPYALVKYAGVNSKSRTLVRYAGFPDSSSIKSKYPDADAFTFDDPTDCNNYKMKKYKASAVVNTRVYGGESHRTALAQYIV
jgi:hypothetical protein